MDDKKLIKVNKDICKKCIALSKTKSWSTFDDVWWDKKHVHCPKTRHEHMDEYGYDTTVWNIQWGTPPWCSYQLEHLLLDEKQK